MKKTIAIITLIAMLLGCVSFNAAAAEAGTYENPQTATNFMGSFLMNTTLEAGNSDGIWYTFTTTAAGIICVENSVQDENRNKIYNYQVAVEVGGKTFYANDTVFSNPVQTFRVAKGTVVKVGMWMLPDESGSVPYGKMYVSASVVSGLDSDPVKVKSAEGFMAPVAANRTVNYLDGSTGGIYTGKGVVLSGDADVIAKTTVTYGTTDYTDSDGDGKIEFSFPKGAEGSMIAPHYAFSITNESEKDAVLVFGLTESAEEGVYDPEIPDEPEIPEMILGDLDNNGSVNGKDSNILKIWLSGAIVPTEDERMTGDVNSDGDLNGKDSNLLAQFISGAITGF